MTTDIVRDVDQYAWSPRAEWKWTVAARMPSGAPKAWQSNGVKINQARTPSGFLCFKVKFPNGKHFNAHTFAEAQEYAERNAALQT